MRVPTGVSMAPKLYEAVNAKLVGAWGDFAGWAHSVRHNPDKQFKSS